MKTLPELTISDLSTDGRGVARLPDGRVAMVTGALAGEKVAAVLSAARKGYVEAVCQQVLIPSPHRVIPPCSWFGICGGCDLQPLDYGAQLQTKAGWLRRALRSWGELPPLEIIDSPAYGYRHRLRLQQSQGALGFFAKKSNTLVAVDNCLLAAPAIQRQWPQADAGCQQVEILGSDEGVLLHSTAAEKNGRHDQPLDYAGGLIYYQRDNFIMKAWPGIFSQINWQVNAKLIACLLRHLEPCLGRGRLLDLFAGSGNLSLPLAHAGAEVWAVESVRRSCQAGEYLAGVNSVKCRFIHDHTAHFLKNATAEYSIVILDPPRAGVKGLMPELLKLKAKVYAFISCHPAALARDGQALLASGYQLTSLTLLDMFPQTGQMECLAIFRLTPPPAKISKGSW